MTRKARKKPKYKPRKLSLDINSLNENSIETKFNGELIKQLDRSKKDSPSLENLSSNITNALQEAAKNTLSATKKINKYYEIWKEDKELNKLLQNREVTEKHSNSYKRLSKEIRKRVNILKNMKLKQEADEINENASRREIAELY